MHASEAGLELALPPRAVFTGAENMLDFQRRDIQAFTGAILSDHYGCTEACGNASRCQELVYHEDCEFGIMEGIERTPGDRAKRIVCTGFACDAFPFISTNRQGFLLGESAIDFVLQQRGQAHSQVQ